MTGDHHDHQVVRLPVHVVLNIDQRTILIALDVSDRMIHARLHLHSTSCLTLRDWLIIVPSNLQTR